MYLRLTAGVVQRVGFIGRSQKRNLRQSIRISGLILFSNI